MSYSKIISHKCRVLSERHSDIENKKCNKKKQLISIMIHFQSDIYVKKKKQSMMQLIYQIKFYCMWLNIMLIFIFNLE